MNSVGKILTELINDLANLVVIFSGASFSNQSLKSLNLSAMQRKHMRMCLTPEHLVSACRKVCLLGDVGLVGP